MRENGCCFEQCRGGSTPYSVPLGITSSQMSYAEAQQEMKTSEDFLASEISKLSVQERSKALEDLHCVGEDLTETPELIETSLFEIDLILEERNDPIYEIAKRQNRAYVENPTFRLRFLRANHHDPEKAADQLIDFLSHKERYFGQDKLARDITLNDLNEDEMNLLTSGMWHIQDGTDKSGRMVVFLFHPLPGIHGPSSETLIRVNYFIYFNLLGPLESVQRKGVVLCYYDMATANNPTPTYLPRIDQYLKFVKFIATVPVRRTALHFCLKSMSVPGSLASNNIILGKLLQSLQRSVRTRARFHYGSDIELQYKLRSHHGFRPKTIPVDVCGNIRRDIMLVWFDKYVRNEWFRLHARATRFPLSAAKQSSSAVVGEGHEHSVRNSSLDSVDMQATTVSELGRRRNPTTAKAAERFVEPTPTDVLLGRGRGSYTHPGNARFRQFLKEYQEQYNNAPRYKRLQTQTDLTRMLMKDGVRFLKMSESGDGWVESDFSEAEKKVKQFFRSQKKLKTSLTLNIVKFT